jgi:hypothetical protein
MSTSSDVREHSADRTVIAVNELTTTGLMIVSAGFTLYPTRVVAGRLVVLGVAAPKGSTVTHTPKLVVHEDDVLGPIPGVVPEKHLYSFDAAEYDISLAGGGAGLGAEAVNFDIVPDFDSISCGLELAPDWRDRVATWIPFDGGQVVAVPDEYYVRQECSWTECGQTTSRQQRLTNRTAYAPPVQNTPTIVLTPRSAHPKPVSIQFKGGPVFAALTNFAEGVDPHDYEVDLSHIHTMLRLSQVVGEVRFTLGRIISNALNLPRVTQWPGWLTTVLRQEETFVGRPHCGARQMREPTA